MTSNEHDAVIGSPKREGFTTVTPYLMVRQVDPVVAFLRAAFGATETYRTRGGSGGTHVEVQIGDARVMMGGDTPGGGMEPVPAALFLYVADARAVFERALAAGATVTIPLGENFDAPCGGGVTDPFGNQWFIAAYA